MDTTCFACIYWESADADVSPTADGFRLFHPSIINDHREHNKNNVALERLSSLPYVCAMDCDEAIAMLRAHETELKSAGIDSLSIFGSVAHGEATEASDIDLVVRLSPEISHGGFAYFGRLDDLTKRLSAILGHDVDLVMEPVRKARLRQEIEREAMRAF